MLDDVAVVTRGEELTTVEAPPIEVPTTPTPVNEVSNSSDSERGCTELSVTDRSAVGE